MKKYIQPILTTLFFLFFVNSFATTYDWRGSTDTSWATASNWFPATGVPSTGDVVTITSHTKMPLLVANTTISQITMTSGTLDCNGLTLTISATASFNGGTINNGTLTCSGTSTLTFAGTTFGAAVNATGNSILLNGSKFNSTFTAVKKGTSNDNGSGGNYFSGAATITDSSSGNLVLSNNSSSPDTFNSTLTVASRSSGSIYLAHQGSGNVFAGKVTMYSSSSGKIYSNYYGTAAYNDSIVVNSTSSGGETFGAGTGSCTLASGKAISIGSEGFDHTASGGSWGTLYLRNFVQGNATAINLTLTGSRATIKFESGCVWYGAVTVSAPAIFLDGSRFLSKVNLTYTTASGYTLTSTGGNYFGDTVTVVQGNSAVVTMGGTAVDTFATYACLQNTGTTFAINNALFLGNVKFKNSLVSLTDHYYVASTGTVTIKGNATIENANSSINFGNSGGTTVLDTNCRITIPAGSGTVNLTNVVQHGSDTISVPMSAGSDVLYLNTGNVFNGPFIFIGTRILLNGTTFNGTVNILRTYNGATFDICNGGNFFNGNTVICDSVSTSNSNRKFALAGTNPDDFNGNVTFKQYASGSGASTVRFYPAYTKNSTFAGNITVDGNSAIEFGANGGKVIIDGAGSQSISKTGSYNPAIKKLELQNTGATCTLNLPLSISDSIIFNSGYLATDTTNLLTVPDNCIVTGASDYSLVVGPVKKIGNDAFTFPIGGPWTETPPIYAVPSNVYHPLSITAPANSGDAYTARYFHANHGFGTGSDTTLELPSTTEYWKLDRNAGSDSVYITLGWGWNSSNTTQLLGMKVAGWNGSTWKDFDYSATTGNTTTGTVKTASVIGAFGYFTTANVHCYLTADAGEDQFIFTDSTATVGGSPTAANGYGSYTYLWSSGQTTQSISNAPVGMYTVEVTDDKGCSASSTISIGGPINGQAPPPTVYYCEDAPITFYGGTTGTNVWDFGDGTTTQSTTALSFVHTFSYPGYFTVVVTNGNYTHSAVIRILPSTRYPDPIYNPICCIKLLTYTDDNLTLTSASSPIANPITWNGITKSIKGTIRILSGAGLTINGNSTIYFGPLGRIIVEAGGLLTINNATLTSDSRPTFCSSTVRMMWEGIEVWGNNSSGTITDQGRVVISNNAKIEDAYNGVYLGKKQLIPLNPVNLGFQHDGRSAAGGGGIIQASYSTFNRCGYSIVFFEYSQRKAWNSISHCSFTCKLNNVNSNVLDPYLSAQAASNYRSFTIVDHNPFFSPGFATLHGYSPISIYVNGRRYININNNTFDNVADAISVWDSEVKIGNGIGSGNTFSNYEIGIYNNNSITSLFGDQIIGNTFNSTGSLYGILENVTMFDGIYNNTINCNRGIRMAGSTNYFIADNNFTNCYIYGIEVVQTGPAAAEIGYIALGNVFTNCWVGVQTSLYNDNLRIRCNKFDHPNQLYWAGFAWDVASQFSLGQQGSYSALDLKAPAGNRFPIYSWGLSNVIRSYLNIPFLYYHHLDNYTTPVNLQGTSGMSPNPDPLNFPVDPDDACAPPCIPPNTNCFNSAIASYQSAIDDLQYLYDDLASKLDGEQTANLLDAIGSDTISNASLGTLLVNNSPLSDEVITYLLESRDSLSSSQYTNIIIPNSPVTKTMYPVISDLIQSLDESDADTLKILQSYNPNYTTLTLLEREIDQNELQRELLVNSLICHYLDSDSVGEAISLLEEQEFIEAKHALVGTYILEGDYESAEDMLESIPLNTTDDTSYYDLYNIYIDLKSQSKMMWEMDSSQLARIYQIAEMCPAGVATGNAQVLLKELFGETFDTCEFNEEERLAHVYSPQPNSLIPDEIRYLGDCIPNPFSSSTYMPYFVPKGCQGSMNVFAASGKLIQSYSLKEGNNVLEINLANFNSGLYLCYMIIDNGAIVRQKKIILSR